MEPNNIDASVNTLLDSPLAREGGYQVVVDLFFPELIEKLQSEAQAQFSFAQRNESELVSPLLERGGQPARRLYTGSGGPCLRAIYHDGAILNRLQQITGLSLVRMGDQGSFSYYLHEGDYLSIHRDFLSCDVTLITTVLDQTPPDSNGGILCLYPDRVEEQIMKIYSEPNAGAKFLKLGAGASVVLLGGLVPHWVLPLHKNERRISALLCYTVAP